jgi:hypothetical protein
VAASDPKGECLSRVRLSADPDGLRLERAPPAPWRIENDGHERVYHLAFGLRRQPPPRLGDIGLTEAGATGVLCVRHTAANSGSAVHPQSGGPFALVLRRALIRL